MKKGNIEFTVYEVCISNIDSWDEDNKIYDEISVADTVHVYFSSICDAFVLYSKYMNEVKNEQVISLNTFDIGVDEVTYKDFVLEANTYDSVYGDFTRYGYSATIEDFYIHENIPYKGDSETLEYMVREKSEFFNMRRICKKAGVSYSTFRNFRGKFQPMSDEKLIKILKAMRQVGVNAWTEDFEKLLS